MSLDDEDACRLQIALVLNQAMMMPDEVSAQQFLAQNLNLHNVSEFANSFTHPCKCLLAMTDGRLQTAAECKTVLKLEPTVYVVCGDYLDQGSSHEHVMTVPGLAMHYSSMRVSPQPDIPPGTCMHGLASWVADALPLQQLFNYLGQGYHVVLAGHGFGGMVAHTLAVRLLLNVRQEINLAKQMGINLSALAQTEEKVSSFAFGAPLVASSEIATALQDQGLASRLHTVWRIRDASPHFYTLCSELATEADGSYANDDMFPPCHNAMTFNVKAPAVQAANNFATAVAGDLVSSTTRKRGHQHFACAPMDLSSLIGSVEPFSRGSTSVADSGAVSESGLPASGKTATPERRRPNGMSLAGGDAAALAAPAASSPVGKVAAAAPRRSSHHSPIATAAVVRAASKAKSAIDKMAASAAVGVVPAAAKSTPAVPVAASAPAAGTDGNVTSGVWKSAVKDLLTKCGSIDEANRYAPLGKFWLLDTAVLPKQAPSGAIKLGAAGALEAPKAVAGAKASAKAADSKAPPTVSLKHLPAARVVASRGEWLTDLNPELSSCWEWSLEEMRRDLMEVFAWVTFRPSVLVEGKLMAREAIIRPNKSLLLQE